MSRIQEASIVLLVLVLWVAPASAGATELTPRLRGDRQKIVEGNNAFALDLYTRLGTEKEGNLFFSPYSISTALAMTYAGARGETETQMGRVLHFSLDQKRLHPAFGAIIGDMNARGERGYQLIVANALWGQRGHRFLDGFLGLIRVNYGGGFREVDFVSNTEAARKTINRWVERQTRDKIKELIKRGVLDSMTRLVLTNAIYFKGKWAFEFKKDFTKDAPFTLNDGTKVDVPTMHQTRRFNYMEGDGFQALEMSYVGRELSMIIFLPRRPDGLRRFEKLFTTDGLARWLPRLRKQKVRVAVPKFKMTSEFRLAKVLSSMGMRDAFSNVADFSGMTGEKELYISAVVHKAFVEVNEEGTEAAAATGVVMRLKAVAVEPIRVFRADHPFIFLIRDNRTKSILFMGRVMNPKK